MPQTQLMGVLNVTPDSFFEESSRTDPEGAIARGVELWQQGADIIDVGGEATSHSRYPEKGTQAESTRVSEEAELERVIPVIRGLSEEVPIPISVDTMRPDVAQAAIEAGATFLNDQTGFRDPAMREVAAANDVRICVMHMQGTPSTMQLNPTYPDGVVSALLEFFHGRVEELLRAGVCEKQIVLDPGICFGKTVDHNYTILHNIARLRGLGFPILVGVSRKSLMSRVLGIPAAELLPATLALNTLVIREGADIIRVHDVAEHRQVIDIFEKGWQRVQHQRPATAALPVS